MHISLRPSRVLLALLVGLLATAAAAGAQTKPIKAPPSKDCARAIIDDWYPDGDVDYLYPLDCYQKAIKSLSGDLQVYSSATDDINRAYRFARRNQPDPGRNPSTSTETTTPETVEPTTAPETTETTTPETVETTPPTTAPETTTATETDFDGTVGGGQGGPSGGGGGKEDPPTPASTGDSSSVPVPLIVLGGLAVLLFAAGGAGYLSRRIRGQEAPEDDPQSAP